MTGHRGALEAIFRAAVMAAHPAPLVDDSVARLLRVIGGDPRTPIWIIALGKAAPNMATVAAERLQMAGRSVAGGVVVGAEAGPTPHPALRRTTGDHPFPGARSITAAVEIDAVARQVGDYDAVLVLVSGGATSLAAAPAEGVPAASLAPLFRSLMMAGWDIAAMNGVRKRFLRWGAGRLAGALAPATIQPALLSDVPGDDRAIIASGPCEPDSLTARDVRDRLLNLPERQDAASWLDPLLAHLDAVEVGQLPETPKPGDRAFRAVRPSVVRGNADALHAAADHARSIGWQAFVRTAHFSGDAASLGARLAGALLAGRAMPAEQAPTYCVIQGGETTVTISGATQGDGGRCQELALSAARVLDQSYASAEGIAILAAGTDGRDGPTDAAGATVDRDTWRRARAAGRDPARDLASHDAYRALDAAGALLRTGLTGTNVMDMVVGVVEDRR